MRAPQQNSENRYFFLKNDNRLNIQDQIVTGREFQELPTATEMRKILADRKDELIRTTKNTISMEITEKGQFGFSNFETTNLFPYINLNGIGLAGKGHNVTGYLTDLDVSNIISDFLDKKGIELKKVATEYTDAIKFFVRY